MPVLNKNISHNKLAGYKIDYKMKPRTSAGLASKTKPAGNRFVSRAY